jgi:hypothetical protein
MQWRGAMVVRRAYSTVALQDSRYDGLLGHDGWQEAILGDSWIVEGVVGTGLHKIPGQRVQIWCSNDIPRVKWKWGWEVERPIKELKWIILAQTTTRVLGSCNPRVDVRLLPKNKTTEYHNFRRLVSKLSSLATFIFWKEATSNQFETEEKEPARQRKFAAPKKKWTNTSSRKMNPNLTAKLLPRTPPSG